MSDVKVGFVDFSREMRWARQQRRRVNHESRLVGEALAASRGRVQDPPLQHGMISKPTNVSQALLHACRCSPWRNRLYYREKRDVFEIRSGNCDNGHENSGIHLSNLSVLHERAPLAGIQICEKIPPAPAELSRMPCVQETIRPQRVARVGKRTGTTIRIGAAIRLWRIAILGLA
jgi:hypothetical protein